MTALDEPTLRLVRSIARWYARRAVRSPAIDADDLFQEGCLAVWKAAPKHPEGVGPELAAHVARRACAYAFRRNLAGEAGAAAARIRAEAPAGRPAVTAEEVLDLGEALGTLRPEHARVLRLRYLESLTLDEAAARMGISRSRAYDLSARGLAELRERLGADYAERWARAVPLRRPDEYKAWARRLGRTESRPSALRSRRPSHCARVAAARLAVLDRAKDLASRP